MAALKIFKKNLIFSWTIISIGLLLIIFTSLNLNVQEANSSAGVMCTEFVYSEWGECSVSGEKTRTVISASPEGCVGGSPVLSTTCFYDACSNAVCRVPASSELIVDAHNETWKIINNSGKDMFVPTKTATEWAQFRLHHPATASLVTPKLAQLAPSSLDVSLNARGDGYVFSWTLVDTATNGYFYEIYVNGVKQADGTANQVAQGAVTVDLKLVTQTYDQIYGKVQALETDTHAASEFAQSGTLLVSPPAIVFNNTSTGNTGTMQTWTVTESGIYQIEAYGAAGTRGNLVGGRGALMSGEFQLNAGETLRILVGQYGDITSSTYGGSGGGTFVVKEVDTSSYQMYDNQYVEPLVVAGGGGGCRPTYNCSLSVMDASITTSGKNSVSGRLGGTDGQGGQGSSDTSSGGGGGGFIASGSNASSGGTGGQSFLSGGMGGDSSATYGEGGYGAGGGNYWAPGGGGGWSGGAGDSRANRTSGGGGSYNAGDNQNNIEGSREGHGLVEITFVAPLVLGDPCNLPWGGTINDGQTATAYQSSSVPCGSECVSETRTCNDGVLSGSYTIQSCSVTECLNCSLPWGGTINHGESIDAYQADNVAEPGCCTSESRVCNDGSLSGSYNYQSCSDTCGLVCGDPLVFNGLNYGTIEKNGLCWLDRNLGAVQVATSYNDQAAIGDYYQWGRAADGHQISTSGTTSTLSASDTPGHSSFIISTNSPIDWRNPQNDNLWQGAVGINNPCPDGWRLSTATELEAERLTWLTNDDDGAFRSILKWAVTGYRANNGIISLFGTHGFVWSSDIPPSSPTSAIALRFYAQPYAGLYNAASRSFGMNVRCVHD